MKILPSIIRLAGLWGLFLLLSSSCSTGGEAIADSPHETAPVASHCQVVDAEAKLSTDEINQLIHVGKGNSTSAMRDRFGLPYCWVGNVEYFPKAEDTSTWIGIEYDAQGNYARYTFSANN